MKTLTNTLVYLSAITIFFLVMVVESQAQSFNNFDSLAFEQDREYKLSDTPKSINANYYTEVTNMSPKTGVSITYATPGYVGDYEIGVFYQAASHFGGDKPSQQFSDQKSEEVEFERSFYGLFTSCTLIDGGTVELDLQVRAGMVNNEHFKIVPSLMGKVRVIDRLSLNAGLGTRSMSLTLLGGLTWKF